MITDEQLLDIQQSMAAKHEMMVDVYHSEVGRIIGVFPHNAPPTPFHSLEVIQY